MSKRFPAVISLCASILAILTACGGESVDSSATTQATPSIGINVAAMDTSVIPGDDFYSYTNGEWMRTIEIPSDRSRAGAFFVAIDSTEEHNAVLIDSLVGSSHPADSDKGRVAAFYKAYVDTAAIDAAALPPPTTTARPRTSAPVVAKPAAPLQEAALVALRTLVVGSLVVALALCFRPEGDLPGAPLTEDGFYSLSVARHAALGHGLTIDGETWTNGFQPLFTLLTIPAFALAGGDRFEALRYVLALHWLFFLATALLLGAIVRDTVGRIDIE